MAALTNSDGLCPRWARQSPGADLVADQRVAGCGVGDAQQRLGEAHQRHALLARQRIFLDQPLDAAGARARLAAQPLRQTGGDFADALGFFGFGGGEVDQRRDAGGLGPAMRSGNDGAQALGRGDLGAQRGKEGRGLQRRVSFSARAWFGDAEDGVKGGAGAA